MSLVDTLVGIEEPFWTAGVDYYARNLAEEFLMVFPEVGFMGREEAIDGVAKGQRWSTVSITDARVTRSTEDAAVLSYEARASRQDDGSIRHRGGRTVRPNPGGAIPESGAG
ncbi:MAG: DUF4440 domain-containing protein [Gemmatimonadota bacterium]|nr:DUF4440 domain-containing protein [Gemmatimonadota bacterium]